MDAEPLMHGGEAVTNRVVEVARRGLAETWTHAAPAALDSASLLAFVGSRRWFGAKGRVPAEARVSRIVPLQFPNVDAAFLTIEITWVDGEAPSRYQLPLVARPVASHRSAGGEVVATIDGTAELVDATTVPAFRDEFVRALARGGSAVSEGARLIFEPVGEGARILAGGDTTRLGSAEQSNTSFMVGSKAIIKLFRRLAAGEHPDAEIARVLTTRTAFRGTPPLLGVARLLESGAGGSTETTAIAIAQGAVDGAVDAWSYALDRGRAYFAAPEAADPANDFVEDAGRLGRLTRDLHQALASLIGDPAFTPRAATVADVGRWAGDVRDSIKRGFALLAHAVGGGALTSDRRAEGAALIARRDGYGSFVDGLVESIGGHAGLVLRHHGDYHLGQVLRSASGEFFVIDFEGEPLRSLEKRREKHSVLRDVAGMMRSFAYAAATLATEARQAWSGHSAILELRSARWEREAREAFLRGYLASGDGALAAFLPDTDAGVRALISLFETEKVFYELAYELNNRPQWVGIPLRGIARLTGPSPSAWSER
ncbi:MAG: hypothetical protein NVS4B3_12700 [Gemmatimonadaceae bacterium]